MVVDRQNAFDVTVNYNVLNIGTVEFPNQLLDTRVICLTDGKRDNRTLETEQVLVYTAVKSKISEGLDS